VVRVRPIGRDVIAGGESASRRRESEQRRDHRKSNKSCHQRFLQASLPLIRLAFIACRFHWPKGQFGDSVPPPRIPNRPTSNRYKSRLKNGVTRLVPITYRNSNRYKTAVFNFT